MSKLVNKRFFLFYFFTFVNYFISEMQKFFLYLREKFTQIIVILKSKSYKFYLKWAGIGLISMFVAVLLLVGSVYFGFFGKLPSKDELKEFKQAQASLVYDSEENLIGKFYIFDRTNISFEELPPHLIEALIATEDVRFYEHKGVDSKSLLRVFFKTILLQDDSSGGGSTLTMQLAKNIFGRKNYGKLSMPIHKIKEILIAKRMEKIYSKKELIELYLNTVPFSDNTYGIESASQRFFGKSAKNLTIGEAATLIGSLKATSNYNPRTSLKNSIKRRNTVLSQMQKYDFISDADFEKLKNDTLKISYQYFSDNLGVAPYFREQIRLQAEQIVSKIIKNDNSPYNLYRDGLKIYTTLDKTLQEYAENSVKTHLTKLQSNFEASYGKKAPWEKENKWLKNEAKKLSVYQKLLKKGFSEEEIWQKLNQKKTMQLFSYQPNDTVMEYSTLDSLSICSKMLNTGFLAVDTQSGAIRAYVGGIDFQQFKYDHIIQSRRQIGSTFKPFVYATAIENGMPICSYFSPKEVIYSEYENWSPKNSSKIEVNEFTYFSAAKALQESINTIAVEVLFQAGIENVIQTAKKLGIHSEFPLVPSIALGTVEVPMIELAQAYTVFANKGIPVSPYFIEKITDKNGVVLWQQTTTPKNAVFNETTVQAMVQMMRGTINQGTASRLRTQYNLPNDMAGKTGTTQNNKDGWFVAITPKMIMLSWVGNDRQIGFPSTRIGQGANSALPSVALFLQRMNKNRKYDSITKATFTIPEEIQEELVQCEPIIEENFIDRLFNSNHIISEKEREQQIKQLEKEAQKKAQQEEKANRKKKSFFEKLFGR